MSRNTPEWNRAYYIAHKDDFRRRYQKTVLRRQEEKLKALASHGPNGEMRCSWPGCKEIDSDVLTLDHVKNDGRVRRNQGEGRGNGLYRAASKAYDPTLQTLCANHNLKKEVERRRELRK